MNHPDLWRFGSSIDELLFHEICDIDIALFFCHLSFVVIGVIGARFLYGILRGYCAGNTLFIRSKGVLNPDGFECILTIRGCKRQVVRCIIGVSRCISAAVVVRNRLCQNVALGIVGI